MDDVHLRQLTDSLLEQLPQGVILTDCDGMIAFVNRTAEKIRNVRRENLLGHNVLNCHMPKSHAGVSRAIENIVKKPETVYRRMVEDSVNGKFYINTYSGLLDAKGQTIGIAVLTEDVTEKRKLELERATTYEMMKETSDTLRRQYHELLLTSLETISKILEARDPYTQNHSRNVCNISMKLYEHRFGVGNEYHMLKTAATLHDIGKIGIPDEILHKPGTLTADEYEIIKQHSIIAESILKPLDSGSEISTIVRHHHERYDGKGYPDKLAGTRIPLCSRIISIADTYDAMRSDRPYRPAIPFDRCVEEITQTAGAQFDPDWVAVFLDLVQTGSL